MKPTSLLLLLACTSACAQDLGLIPNFPPQKDSPAIIERMTSSITDLASKLDIKNVSDKTIIEIQVGWVTESPPSCASQPIAPMIDFSRPEQVDLKPGKRHSGTSYRVGTARMRENARKLNSRLLHVQFGIVNVKFEDGSTWRYDLKKEQTFDNHTATNQFACTPELEQRIRSVK